MSNEIILRKVIKTDKDIRQKFIERRKELGITQKQLATLAQTDQAEISRFEHGKDVLLSTFVKYIGALGQAPDWRKATKAIMTQKPAGIGIGYTTGTVTWGEVEPGESRMQYVIFEDVFDEKPDIKLEILSGYNNVYITDKVTREGFYLAVKNVQDIPQTIAIQWSAEK